MQLRVAKRTLADLGLECTMATHRETWPSGLKPIHDMRGPLRVTTAEIWDPLLRHQYGDRGSV